MPRLRSPYERYGIYRPRAEAQNQVHTYLAGESLTGLAQRYYGDWRKWRLIADRNNIVDARRLDPGAQLIIPPPPLPKMATDF